jgi:hypothetical protein
VELLAPAPLRVAYDIARHSPRGRRAVKGAQRALRGRSVRRRDTA